MVGNEVLMVSGSDVHGTPITVRADAEAERTRALRLVVGVLGRDRVERALANGGIGSLLREGRTAYRPTGSMGPPTDAARRSRSDEMYHVTSW